MRFPAWTLPALAAASLPGAGSAVRPTPVAALRAAAAVGEATVIPAP